MQRVREASEFGFGRTAGQLFPFGRLSVMLVPAICLTLIGCGEKSDEAVVLSADQSSAAAEGMATANAVVSAGMIAGAEADDESNTEAYDHIVENGFRVARRYPLSTFSVDVDTASYANIRRFLTRNRLPPAGAVRIEEMVNYFGYDYAPPVDEHPFAVHVDMAPCPWNTSHRLARIGLQGRALEGARPPANLVFLVDVSGSMAHRTKLPLVKSALRMLVSRMNGDDHVALVVYAGNAGLVLPPTSGENQGRILQAIEQLESGGSTNGGEGIQLAYDVAVQNFIRNGANRVILCTDGDFNVGISNRSDLVDLIERQAKSGVYLTMLGFGSGNLKDSTMEQLADRGNGNYAYIDRVAEAHKVLIEQLAGTLVTIARDVKVQVDFNPARIAGYRLIGYENRMLKSEDFRDDDKDAGEIGAGHTVTALYEIVPAGVAVPSGDVEPSKYQTPPGEPAASSEEFMTVRLRYQRPDSDDSTEFHVPVSESGAIALDQTSEDFRFAAAVAGFGMLLRQSEHSGSLTLSDVQRLAESGRGTDRHGRRAEFCELVRMARSHDDR